VHPSLTGGVPSASGIDNQLIDAPLHSDSLESAQSPASSTVSCHNSQLAQKARGRAPAVAATQNVLVRKLGLASTTHIETSYFDRYLELFNHGLSEDQAHQIDEMFMIGSMWPVGSSRDRLMMWPFKGYASDAMVAQVCR
jgi:hypothetical protein